MYPSDEYLKRTDTGKKMARQSAAAFRVASISASEPEILDSINNGWRWKVNYFNYL